MEIIDCKFLWKFTEDIFILNIIKLKKGGGITENSNGYCEIYKELADMLGDISDVEKIYNRYKGLTITFPKKLYSAEYVFQYIEENYGKETVQTIARHLGLSERRVRQIIQDMKEIQRK